MKTSESRYLLDTSFIIDYLAAEPYAISCFAGIADSVLLASVVTRIELFCSAGSTPKKDAFIRRFLENITVVPLVSGIERNAIAIRRVTKRKLPDAVIAASAVYMDAVLVTSDKRLAAASFPGLQIIYPH